VKKPFGGNGDSLTQCEGKKVACGRETGGRKRKGCGKKQNVVSGHASLSGKKKKSRFLSLNGKRKRGEAPKRAVAGDTRKSPQEKSPLGGLHSTEKKMKKAKGEGGRDVRHQNSYTAAGNGKPGKGKRNARKKKEIKRTETGN